MAAVRPEVVDEGLVVVGHVVLLRLVSQNDSALLLRSQLIAPTYRGQHARPDTDLQPREVLRREMPACHTAGTMNASLTSCACPCRPTAMQGGWCIEACDSR